MFTWQFDYYFTEKNWSKTENNFLCFLHHIYQTLHLYIKSPPLSSAQEYFSSYYPLSCITNSLLWIIPINIKSHLGFNYQLSQFFVFFRAKLLRRVVQNHDLHFLSFHLFLNSFPPCFHLQHSTETALVKVTQDLLNAKYMSQCPVVTQVISNTQQLIPSSFLKHCLHLTSKTSLILSCLPALPAAASQYPFLYPSQVPNLSTSNWFLLIFSSSSLTLKSSKLKLHL